MKRWWPLLVIPFVITLVISLWPKTTQHHVVIKQPKTVTKIDSKPKENERKIASVPTMKIDQKKKREWIGNKDDIITAGQIRFKNRPKKNWLQKLESSLRRGLPENTKLEIKPEREVVLVNGQVGTNAQQVVVVFKAPLNYNSYRAMVDSESGKILRTWDHTLHENFGRQKTSLTAFPIIQSED